MNFLSSIIRIYIEPQQIYQLDDTNYMYIYLRCFMVHIYVYVYNEQQVYDKLLCYVM